ncbi:MAG: family 10 glycosylhydrolase [Bacteroidota bacterium]
MVKQCCVLIFGASLFLVGCGMQVFTGKHEARGVWMSRFEYTGERFRSPDSAKARIRQVFEKARSAKFNMVFFQVRGSGDALYRSHYEPWSQLLTDTLGKDPGWDPLEFAVAEAHRLGLELHAWMNTFPMWRGSKLPPLTTPPSPYFAHPEWIICDSAGKPMKTEPGGTDYIWASPGIPEVRKYVVSIARDIVENYDVDGIHFDYIRYPEGSPVKGYSHDSVSVARFMSTEGNPYRISWDHWQREQVNEFVFDAYNTVSTIKPRVKMSASVIGKYMGQGWTSYYVVYQDPRRWMEVGKIDFIVPMVYWERQHPTHPFVPLITEWHDRVAYDRQVVPGLAMRLMTRLGWQEIAAEILEVRKRGLSGVVFFSASGLEKAWDLVGMDAFPYWADVPRLAWKDSIAPAPPTALSVEGRSDGIVLRWQAPPDDSPLNFNIYRSSNPQFSHEDAYTLLTVTPRGTTEFLDSDALKEGSSELFYAVSSVDFAGNESSLTPIASTRIPAVTQR